MDTRILHAYKYMCNSFSLSVYFLLVKQCNVLLKQLRKMKLISLIIIITINGNTANEHFTFPTHFQNHNHGIFSSESSIYLPPESHTPMPYFSIKDFNNLPYPYIPPNNNKGHPIYSTPFPFIVSSTLIPSDDNDENDDRNNHHRQASKFTVKPQIISNVNRTERTTPAPTKRELRPVPNNFKLSQQIDRNDKKPFPFAPNNLPNTMKNTVSQTASPRSLIISPENSKSDQVKSGSFLAPQYLTSPGLFLSSTTEPAIPILRLSNEMDLDGSFSYEALGADQTHYIQQSRMENFGTDKQEQVVEGSYSYVGDNGQTYTVHYIADSNGFRASGDHLPVAPPVPEIIQRAIQYNLAEEARNPQAHTNYWEYENKEISENEKMNRFAYSPPQNLFTGKTPESFSHSFSQASNNQNNFIAAASTNTIKTVDFSPDHTKSKVNSEAISPQITFVASQGAHVPSANKAQQQSQQTISRMFTSEKPTLPQLMNYEATENESNKALWRWQYGLNGDDNENRNKNAISRSSGNDVIINFHDMTPEQYSQMIKNEVQHEYIDKEENKNEDFSSNNNKDDKITQYSTRNSPIQNENWESEHHQVNSDYKNNETPVNTKKSNYQTRSEARAKLITLNEFLPPSQTITQSYDYVDGFGAKKTKAIPEDRNLNVIPLNKPNQSSEIVTASSHPLKQNLETFIMSTPSNTKFTDFIIKEGEENFKPIFSTTEEPRESTTEFKDALKENLFLKNIFSDKSSKKSGSNSNNESKDYLGNKPNDQMKSDKSVRYYSEESKPFDLRKENNKPVDMADFLKHMSSKSNFESSKLRPRLKSAYNDQKDEMKVQNFDQPDSVQKDEDIYNSWEHQQQEEHRGLIKNYKVLQRKNNEYNNEERIDQHQRISPPIPGSLQQQKLPPLGRAGPSMKIYQPPIYI